MIDRLLVANRAEIASRVFRTCRSLGIATVAVHSDADAGLPYVREADLAVRLPGNTPAETYLDADAVLAAARAAGADAVHPGYGFLSENAAFAHAVEAAGLTWVGPAPESIEAMGSKIEAKRLMRGAGVPTLEAPEEPTEADLPLLVKASAGGGGRGMRVVRSLDVLDAEIAAAEAEALSAFGDGTVFVEPYVERGRHVEVQVVGTTVYGDRDCSLQRRHQKVVEEAPAPGLSDDVRAALHEAARKAAEAIDYRGAGTVEFLYDPDTERFFFLEMNTRLQVEHPVTEAVHGIDLVALQLEAAEAGGSPGERPPVNGWVVGTDSRSEVRQPVNDCAVGGHAIEVRLYAEDPAADYAPQSGLLTLFEVPDGVRVDAGYESGSTVSTHYDAMLAKVVAHAPTRELAARKLAGVLERARIHGVRTNRDQLVAVLRDQRFLAGEVSTALLAEIELPETDPSRAMEAAAHALAERARAERTVQRGIPVAWRNVPSQPQLTSFESGDVTWWPGGAVAASPTSVTLEHDGVRTTYAVTVSGPSGLSVDVDWPGGHVTLTRKPRFVDPADAVATGSLLAPMPGTVVAVHVQQGEEVEAGQPVLVLEAMKMQHTVRAPGAGTVTQLDVRPGAQVAAGEVLAVVEEQ
ncbi:acetyl/propionyl-CoA carboxylase subunit alpha [Nocardioides anomalus]|uniref:Acetyl/propionyl-CoA carboxylase subunit alpha n=1 Tax=Nocardioides anomalus TaxID=2712223 RepID=A0A6G6WIL1_9ACTN|nr:biotin carboxylase N-terminal domain-containing protein [Nocardioides anomalus]QIG45059.1 acetyl/propionyl-CoA carboxylase subunit alpha [Nocardioides anomalus]